MSKPFSQACENNKAPILEQLRVLFSSVHSVLEIGTGTGQHAVFFARHLPHIEWLTSDLKNNHDGIKLWLDENPLKNIKPPVEFRICQHNWPIQADAVFTANTTHIMQSHEVEAMMKLVSHHLPLGGLFCQYGPFNKNGKYFSESNRNFDQTLKERGYGGIRDIEELQQWTDGSKLYLAEQILMPANNLLLVWRKL